MTYWQTAQLFGVVSTLLALGILFHLDHAKKMAHELVNGVSGYTLAGVLPTIFGTWVLVMHTNLGAGWHSLIAIIGWLMLISGASRLLFVHTWQNMLNKYLDKMPILFSLFGLMLGLILCYIGFLSHHL